MEYDRRTLLRVGLAGGVIGSAGCTEVGEPFGQTGTDEGAGWPMFHSDRGNTGYSSVRGPAADVTVRWQVELDVLTADLPPVVVDGTLYAARQYLHAVDTEEADQKWQGDLGYRASGDAVSQTVEVRTAPAVTDGTVYLAGVYDTATTSGRVWAIDAESREEAWHFDTDEGIYFTSPTVVDGTVFQCTWHPRVYALDASTGAEAWRTTLDTGNTIRTTPAVAAGTVYVSTLDFGDGGDPAQLVALDAATGEEEWTRTFPPDTEAGAARQITWTTTPLVADGSLYVVTHTNRLYALDAETGEERWSVEIADPTPGAALTLVEGTLVVPTDGLAAFDAATGEEEWSLSGETVQSRGWAAADDRRLYVTDDEGAVHAVSVDAGEHQWRVTFDSSRSTAPVVAAGVVYVINGRTIRALDEA